MYKVMSADGSFTLEIEDRDTAYATAKRLCYEENLSVTIFKVETSIESQFLTGNGDSDADSKD